MRRMFSKSMEVCTVVHPPQTSHGCWGGSFNVNEWGTAWSILHCYWNCWERHIFILHLYSRVMGYI